MKEQLFKIKGEDNIAKVHEILHYNDVRYEAVDAYTEVCTDIMNSVSQNSKPQGVSDEDFKSACETVLDLLIRKYDFQDLVEAAQDYLRNELGQ